MTKSEWLETFNKNREQYINIIRKYHPAFLNKHKSTKITAKAAEAACEVIRSQLDDVSINLESQNAEELLAYSNAAWFGVPEDRDLCNSIPGFWKLCDLLSDVWEE